jgi:hypothetical protein
VVRLGPDGDAESDWFVDRVEHDSSGGTTMMIESPIRVDLTVKVEPDLENPGFFRAMAHGVSMRSGDWFHQCSD